MSFSVLENYLNYVRLHRGSLKYFSGLKDSSSGRDLYIIGSGPSLLQFDGGVLSGAADVIYLNNAVRYNHEKGSGRRIVAITDFMRMDELKDFVLKSGVDVVSSSDKVFNETVDWRVYSDSNFILPRVLPDKLAVDMSQSFSTMLGSGVFIGYSVLFLALQIAYLMRPERIFLVGIDMTSNKGEYFDDSIKSNWGFFDYERDARSHLIACRQAFSSIGIPLLNCSKSSMIDVVPVV